MAGADSTPGVGAALWAGLVPEATASSPSLTLSEVQYAAVTAASAGANTLVDAVASQRIRVVALVLVASGGTNTVRLRSGASGPAITAQMDLANDGQLVLPYNPAGWCETVAGDLLNLELSDAGSVAGMLGYVMAEE